MNTTTVGAFEAKTHLGQLLDRVESGEEIEITRRGRLVARLVPPRSTVDTDALQRLADRVREERGQWGITLKEIQDWKTEGRR